MATYSTAGALSFEDTFEEIANMDEYWSFFAENPTLNPPELLLDPDPANCPRLLNSNFWSDDPIVWDFRDWGGADVNGKFSESGGFGLEGEISNNGVNGLENSVSGVFSVQSDCSCCQRLRVIVHTTGMNVKRLEIHGTLGTITHAVLETYDSSFQSQEFQMFDFHKESMQNVKSFLITYFETCERDGYILLQDPLSTFYEVLCVGLNMSVNHNNFLKLSSENAGYRPKKEQEILRQEPKHVKIPLSLQRVRTRKLELKDMIEHFDLPMEDAARKMNICPTVLKKICRRSGLLRWPYRKIRSIKRKISERREVLSASNHSEKAQLMTDIEKYQQQLANIYGAFQ